ncbi:metal-dependent hydrolase [marine bacterium AO1-C]|nr:metal-dependent hydrolase [marine bacterium AO1-C]
MNQLSFPIGQFTTPDQVTPEEIQQFIERIAALPAKMRATVANLTPEQLNTPYRPEGWTVLQVIHHVPDSHMNAYIRFQWGLTEDAPTIKVYNEKDWTALEYLNEVPPEVSLTILESVHQRLVYLLRSLDEASWNRTFFHPEYNQEYSLKQALAMYAWHGDHHLAHITSLKERMNW